MFDRRAFSLLAFSHRFSRLSSAVERTLHTRDVRSSNLLVGIFYLNSGFFCSNRKLCSIRRFRLK
jgi:hypothetical protein